ncbi:MAG TPA: hypothetical protein DDZ89_07265 [Clostridiales bacterium]|nr:hypothetical protein [Clostridiales bacterium]
MRYAIVDNATLTAVQRLLGDIPIYNKHAIDGDILAFETLIQSILFFDEVYYVNDYKAEYKDQRSCYFGYLGQLDIDDKSYEALLKETTKFSDDVIPQIQGGVFTDSNFNPFFELLKMHNIFTWDMSSSVYYLTQKMLTNSRTDIDIEKYSKLNQMIFSEINDNFAKRSNKKFIILDSKGTPITQEYTVQDKEGSSQEAYIGKQTELLMANLSWLAYRTIFYTLVAKETGGTLILHPIRNAFQINFLSRLFPQSNEQYRILISALNASVEESVRSIFAITQPLITKYPLPMFSIILTNKAGSPKEAINAAFHMKNEGDFIEARRCLSEIEQLFAKDRAQKATMEANKLKQHVEKLMERINAKYYVKTSQGLSLSPVITAYNLGATFLPGVLPTFPNYSAKIKSLDRVKDLIPQKGFNAVYKSLINDLTQISRLGEYHEMLTSQVVYHENASFYTSKSEDAQYMHAKSSWKIPM